MRVASGRGQIMRRFMWLTGLTLGMVWAGAAQAQLPNMSSVIKFPKSLNVNVIPSITNNSPMDYRSANAPIAGSYSIPNTTGTAFPFRLTSMFGSPMGMNSIAGTTTFGRSTFPTPAQMQSAAPGYFQAFQMYRAPFIGGQ